MLAFPGTLMRLTARINLPAVIVVLAVVLRLAFVILFGNTLSLQASGYDEYAANLIAGHGYTRFADLHPDSDVPPLYSFFLAGVYLVLGRSPIPVALIQIGFDVITILAIYSIGKRVAGNTTGLLAAAFTAFYPYLLFQNLTTNDTAIFIMLLVLGVWAAYHVETQQDWRWAMLAGVCFGLAALTKTLVILLLPMLALPWLWRWKLQATKVVIAMGIPFMLVIMPWIIRNTRLHGTFTLISLNDGSNLYQGNNPCVADLLLAGWDAQWSNCMTPTPPGMTQVQESAWFREQALTYLRTHVDQWPRLFAAKFINLWTPDLMPNNVPPFAKLANDAVLQYEQPAFLLARKLHLLYFTPLLILAIIGLWRAATDRRPIWPIVAVLIAITVAYLIYHPSTRYRSPADPFLFVLSAYGLLWLYGLILARWQMTRRKEHNEPVSL
jgi:4-amino-4-deoxy-L-arabinose transferase-like glycosyltransferase